MSTAITVKAESYGLPEKLINAIATVSYELGLPLTNMSPDHVLDAVAKEMGSREWGDERFIEIYRYLWAQIDRSAMTPMARAFIRVVCKKAIINRVKTERWLKEHPEVLDQPVDRPTFVVGFPRTGTTVLHNLLPLHPTRRALKFWELTAPVPAFADPVEDERRRKRNIDRVLKMAFLVAPEQENIHAVRADTPEECWSLFANSFAVLNFEFQWGLGNFGPGYLYERDMVWAYKEYRRYLQMLLHQRPADRLILKCPEHLWFLDALLDVFPDGNIVWTHRDPFECIASYCSLISMNRRVYYGKFNPPELGPYITDRFFEGVTRAMAVRDRVGDDRFMDVQFTELVQDQNTAVRNICRRFDLAWDEQGSTEIDAWLAEARGDKRGRHKYDAERYGLDAARIDELFAPYVERFGIRTDQRH